MKSLIIAAGLTVLSPLLVEAATLVRPKFSEFQVVFPKDPVFSENTFIADDGTEGLSLNASLADPTGFFRAEFLAYGNPAAIKDLTDAEIRERGLALAKHNGLRVSDLTIDRVDGARVVRIRGTKVIQRSAGELAVTYVINAFYGSISMMSITVGAPSEIFPTREIAQFLESAK